MLSVPFPEDLASCWRVNTSTKPAVQPLRCSQWDWWYWERTEPQPGVQPCQTELCCCFCYIKNSPEIWVCSLLCISLKQAAEQLSVCCREGHVWHLHALEFMFNSFSGARASIKRDKAMTISSSTSVKTKLWRSFLVPWWQWKGEIIGMDAFRAGPSAVCVLWYRAA